MSREAFSQATIAQPLTGTTQHTDSEAVIAALLASFSAADFDPDNVVFPDDTSGVYADLSIAEYKLRVYAMMHLAPLNPGEVDASLFLVLGSLKGSYLPVGSRLTVTEKSLLLTEPGLHWTEHSTYVYTQVFGDWQEKFTIEIGLPNARPKVLSPLTFTEGRSLNPVLDQLAA